jgi:hypothetical protein
LKALQEKFTALPSLRETPTTIISTVIIAVEIIVVGVMLNDLDMCAESNYNGALKKIVSTSHSRK